MIQNFARGNGQAKGVKRVIGIVVAAALAVSGVQAVASAQTGAAAGAPYNPVDEYTGFNVVTFDDLHLDAVVEGPVAVGGQLSWGHTQINIRQDAEAALVVKGGIDWPNSSGVLHVNGTQGLVTNDPLDINLIGSDALNRPEGGSYDYVKIVETGDGYHGFPRIELTESGRSAENVAYDTSWDSLLDQGAAVSVADTLAEQSRQACLAGDVLQEVANEAGAEGNEPAFWRVGDEVVVKLAADGQNVWNLSAAEFSNIGGVTFRSPAPSAANPLFINVAGTDHDFDFDMVGLAPSSANGILWNFYEAENLNLPGASVTGSVLAPNAHLDKDGDSVDGTVIVESGDLRGSELNHFPFEGEFTPCVDGEGPTTEPTTTEPTTTEPTSTEPTTTEPTTTPSEPNGSSDLGQCISNTSSVSNPAAWLIPIAVLAGVGVVAQPLVQPIIDALIAEANASISEMTPNVPVPQVGVSVPDYGNEVVAELQSTLNAINAELANIAAGVPQEAVAVALAAAGVIAAGAAYEMCQEQGYIGYDFAQD